MRFLAARVGVAAAGLMILTSCGPGGSGPGTPTPPRINRFVYVVSIGERNLSWYSVADGNGRLRPEGYLQQVARATRIDLVDSHRLILTDGDARITSYSRDLTTGRPQRLGDVRQINHYAISPQGDFVIASKGTGDGVEIYRITDTGVDPTFVANLPMGSGMQLTRLFYHPSGRWVYGPSGNDLKRLAIDLTAATPITYLSDAFTDPNGASIEDVIFERQGWRALIVLPSSVVRVDVSTADGGMTPRFQPVPAAGLSSVRVHPSGNWLFAIEGGQVKTRRLDPDFVPSATTTSSAGFAVGGYSWDSTGELVTITSPSRTIETFRFDAATGAFTQVSYQYDPWAHTTVAVSAGATYATKSELVALVINKADSTIQSFKVLADGTLTLASTLPSGGMAPSALAVSPHDPFVYVAHEDSGDVSVFSVNTATGALAPVGPLVSVGARPADIVVEPSGRFVYVANVGDNTISTLDVDATTGALSAGDPVRSTMATGPSALAIDPRGLLLYAGSSAQAGPAIEMFSITSSGRPNSIASVRGSASGVVPGALALRTDPYGELLLSTYSGTAGRIGYCPLVTTLNCAGGLDNELAPMLPRSIAVDGRRGRVFVLGSVPTGTDFTVSPYQYRPYAVTTPAPTPVQLPTTLSSIFTDPVEIVSSYSGDWQYVVDRSRNRIALFDADAHNELTLRSSFATGNGPVAMALILATE